MLEELSVSNYALIDDIRVTFSKGFNALTGETGAGKSLLVGSLGLIFGKKANPDYVRKGAEEASVSATVDISNNLDAKIWLKEKSISYEDDIVLIKRNIKKSGRGSQYIEGQGIVRKDLEEFSNLLFDLHGQHEHQSLFNSSNHRKLLDRYGVLSESTIILYNKFQNLTKLREKLRELEEKEDDAEAKVLNLQKSIKEIKDADLIEGEEEELERELRLLRNTDKISTNLEAAIGLSLGGNGLLTVLKEVLNNVDSVTEYEESFKSFKKRLKDSYFEVEDIIESLKDYKLHMDFSPETLQFKEERLSLIYTLEKKYGATIKDVLEFVSRAEEELEVISSQDQTFSALQDDIKREQDDILKTAKDLSVKRKDAASSLEEKVIVLLKELSLPNVRFKVDINQRRDNNGNPSCGPWGIDEIEFLMSMNPGEPLKPVKQIASGGEISRIMLALKSVLADVDNVGCLIFDEIDSGIGGEVALSIGEHLKALSVNKQVLSITHLASIASSAENHLKVVKTTDGVKTNTSVLKLDGDERVREIARMLSGECNEASMNHARELLGIC